MKQVDLLKVCGDDFRYLVLFVYGLFDKICDKVKYLISEKSGITDIINHNFGKISIDSYNSFTYLQNINFLYCCNTHYVSC